MDILWIKNDISASQVFYIQKGFQEEAKKETKYLEGWFESPYGKVFPEMMPENVGQATWRGIFPKSKKGPLVVHLAGTGDHTFYRSIRIFHSFIVLLKAAAFSMSISEKFMWTFSKVLFVFCFLLAKKKIF